jgi:hypothetical protein
MTEKKTADRDWLISSVLVHPSITILTGGGRVGKSLFSMQLQIARAREDMTRKYD